MYLRDNNGRRRRLLLLLSCVVATTGLAAACGKKTSAVGDQARESRDDARIQDVHVSVTDSGLIVNYRTRTSIRDCKAQAAEMPKVWDRVVRARLKDSTQESVVLFPEEASGQSLAIQFTKTKSGDWSASAPCSISIPAS